VRHHRERDDYDDIVDWGKAHLAFLRGFAELCADWLRCIMNRIDPDLFMDCFTSWVAACWPDKLDLVAIDGKTSRRTHNRRTRTRRSIWCRPSRPTAGWCSAILRDELRRRYLKNPTRAPRYQL
jgi:hypothetical protein